MVRNGVRGFEEVVHAYDMGDGENELCVWMNICLVCVKVFA